MENKAKSANQLPSKVIIASAKVRRQKSVGKSLLAKVPRCSAKVGQQKSQVARQKLLGKSCKAKVITAVTKQTGLKRGEERKATALSC